jgi:hypothetical protein
MNCETCDGTGLLYVYDETESPCYVCGGSGADGGCFDGVRATNRLPERAMQLWLLPTSAARAELAVSGASVSESRPRG